MQNMDQSPDNGFFVCLKKNTITLDAVKLVHLEIGRDGRLVLNNGKKLVCSAYLLGIREQSENES